MGKLKGTGITTHRNLDKTIIFSFLKWLENPDNRHYVFGNSINAAKKASEDLGRDISHQSILYYRGQIYPELLRKNSHLKPNYRPGIKTYNQLITRIEIIEETLKKHSKLFDELC
jgi:hypothetical protein